MPVPGAGRDLPQSMAELARWRLASQGLPARQSLPAGPGGPARAGRKGAVTGPPASAEQVRDVVARMLAMQAQDYGQAVWAIGARLPDPEAGLATVEQAIAQRQIVRTWPMRGTIHWVAPPDVRWLLRLCGSRLLGSGAYATRLRQLELTPSDLTRAGELLGSALGGGQVITRAQAMQVFEDGGLSTAGQRGYHLLVSSALKELICFGPMQGKQQTFVLLDDWVPPHLSRDLAGDEALAELALRYTTARGPVTAQDLAHWAGITLTSARRGLEAAGDALTRITIGDVEYRHAGPEPARAEASSATAGRSGAAERQRGDAPVLLLPGFDEYLLGYRDRAAMLAAEHAHHVVPGGNGVFKPMVVIDGQITGTWQRTVRAHGVTITRTPFLPGSEAPEAGVRRQAERYAAFLGVPLAGLG